MSDQATIAEGREAWERIKAHSKPLFGDWLRIGRALTIGRSTCMKAASCNTPYGPGYQREIKTWMEATGFADLDSHERLGAIFMAENERDLSAWHAALPEVARRNCNHPNTILMHFRNGSIPQKSGPKPKPQNRVEADRRKDAAGYGPRVERPAQDKIRFVAAAMRQGWTTDIFRLAVTAIAAADRYDAGLVPAAAPREIQSAIRAELELQ